MALQIIRYIILEEMKDNREFEEVSRQNDWSRQRYLTLGESKRQRPPFDRGRDDAPHLIAVVVEEKDEKLRVATKHGFLNWSLERNSVPDYFV